MLGTWTNDFTASGKCNITGTWPKEVVPIDDDTTDEEDIVWEHFVNTRQRIAGSTMTYVEMMDCVNGYYCHHLIKKRAILPVTARKRTIIKRNDENQNENPNIKRSSYQSSNSSNVFLPNKSIESQVDDLDTLLDDVKKRGK